MRSRAAAVPARLSGATGAYGVEVLECDAAGHCTTSPGRSSAGTAPRRPPDDGSAAPLGPLAARDGGT